MFLLLVPQLDLFSQKYQQQASAYLSSEFLINVIPLQEAVSDPDENEVRACEKEHKLIKEDGLASTIPNQLEDEHQRHCPLQYQNRYKSDSLIIIDMFHSPVKQ